MNEIVISSNNQGKIKEFNLLLPSLKLLSLKDIGFYDFIEEPFETFNENANVKTKIIYDFCDKNVFSDDSGLCVEVLNNAPGVHSAYWGGLPRSDEKNNEKLLALLNGFNNRNAYYISVICLIWNGKTHYFEGRCYGKIACEMSGNGGFGYDPLFIPDGFDQTFASLPLSIKNQISHRGFAIGKMIEFLKQEGVVL